jgi:ParB-like chromosome segregation protein Spo0J
MVIISGGLRLKALKRLGRHDTPIRLFAGSKAQLWALALADNLNRRPNAAEKARLWRALVTDLGDNAQNLAARLDIPPNPKIQNQYFLAAQLPDNILLALAQDKLDLASATRLAELGPEGEELWALMEAHRPSLQNRRLWLEWLEDLARRENKPLVTIVRELQNWPANSTLAWGERLRQKRFPKLAQLEERRRKLLKTLPLPPACSLKLDPTFEDVNAEIRLSFGSPAELAARAGALAQLAAEEKLKELWELAWPE